MARGPGACGHDHAPSLSDAAVADTVQRAEARTLGQGQRWTEPRRRVYELLVRAGAPVKAYDLMDLYAESRPAKPPTVYRALDYLAQNGFAHRIASLNAFVACGAETKDHAAAFLICDCCGSAEEFQPGPIPAVALAAARDRAFQIRTTTLEVRGRCRRCR